MKITLDALDGRNFTLRIPRDEGGEHVVALHDTRRLRGAYDHDATRFSLDPLEADALVGEVAWVLASGSLHLGGPASLGATRLDLDIRRDDRRPGGTGDARCASLDAPAARLKLDGFALDGALAYTALEARHDVAADAWRLSAATVGARAATIVTGDVDARFEALDARGVDATLGATTSLSLAEVVARDVSLAAGDVTVKAETVTLTGLRVTRGAALSVAVDAIELGGVEVTRGAVRAQAPTARLDGFAYGPDEIAVTRIDVDTLALAIEGLAASSDEAPADTAPDATPPGARRTLGVDLPFLDHVTAKIDADVVVDVKLPIITRRVATHRLRLAIDDGAFDFKQLEHGLSALEDSVIDFEVGPDGLELELDAVVVKRELLLWPLDVAQQELARRNRVRLRTFARPTMVARAAPSRDEGDEDPRVALHRVEVQGIDVEGSVRGASTLPLGQGVIRLGRGDTAALGLLRVSGGLVHDVTQSRPETTLRVALESLDAGLDALAVGARCLDVDRVRLGRLDGGEVTFRGFRPTSASATLHTLAVEGLRLRGAPAAQGG